MLTKGRGSSSVVDHVFSMCEALGLSLRITRGVGVDPRRKQMQRNN